MSQDDDDPGSPLGFLSRPSPSRPAAMDSARGARSTRRNPAPSRQRPEAQARGQHLDDATARSHHNLRPQITPDSDGRRPEGRRDPLPPNPFRLHRLQGSSIVHPSDPAVNLGPGARLSMPFGDFEDTGSEPDLSHLGIVHGGNASLNRHLNLAANANIARHARASAFAPDNFSHDDFETGEGSLMMRRGGGDDEEEEEEEDREEVEGEEDNDEDMEGDIGEDEEVEHDVAALMDPAAMGLKEISNLGKFTVSSHKPGNGVEELRSDDLKLYWQSDGPQPHKLTVYFVKRVGIRDIRFFVNYGDDESYTPTRIIFKSGTSENNLIEFAAMNLESPVGWQQVPVAGAGGGPDGNTLISYVLQMQIHENHQNGKDTHLRGIKIYAFDSDTAQGAGADATRSEDVNDASAVGNTSAVSSGPETRARANVSRLDDISRALASSLLEAGDSGFPVPDFMRDPEIR